MRQRLERHQAWVYLAAILLGLALGSAATGAAQRLEVLVWPLLALLLYATFTQVPLTRLPSALRDGRFVAAVLVGNFLVIPLAVWALLPLVGTDAAVRTGVLLVLLVPCTDWFLTFTHLAGGDTRRAIAITPVNLLVQLLVLPLYLWLFLGEAFAEAVATPRAVTALTTLILLPLAAAWVTQALVARRQRTVAVIARFGVLPVPLLAAVVFAIAASQVSVVLDAGAALGRLVLVYVAFLIVAAALGLGLARLLGLEPGAARALVFSMGTRNSFVVLPIALALPAGFEVAVVVVVLQSLVELFGMVAYLRLVPRLIPRSAAG
jgi:arsenite transporter